MAILSTMVGAMTLARMVNDPKLAQAFLKSAAKQVREVAATSAK
jgi:TetR/AcrR family transcriptional repressor of nem operon